MMEASRQPKNNNLVAVLYQSSDNVESLKTYAQDAEEEGDQELGDFFGGILENNLEPPSESRRCSSPGSRTNKSRGRLRTYQGGGTSEEPDPRYPCSP